MSNNDKKVQKTQMFLPNWPEPLDLRNAKSEVIATDHYQILLECAKGRKNRPFHGSVSSCDKNKSSNIHQHHWKERLKIRKFAKFKVGEGARTYLPPRPLHTRL